MVWCKLGPARVRVCRLEPPLGPTALGGGFGVFPGLPPTIGVGSVPQRRSQVALVNERP